MASGKTIKGRVYSVLVAAFHQRCYSNGFEVAFINRYRAHDRVQDVRIDCDSAPMVTALKRGKKNLRGILMTLSLFELISDDQQHYGEKTLHLTTVVAINSIHLINSLPSGISSIRASKYLPNLGLFYITRGIIHV